MLEILYFLDYFSTFISGFPCDWEGAVYVALYLLLRKAAASDINLLYLGKLFINFRIFRKAANKLSKNVAQLSLVRNLFMI